MSEAGKVHKLLRKEQRVANHNYHERKLEMKTKEELCMLLTPRFWSVRVAQPAPAQVPMLLQRKPVEIPAAHVDGQDYFMNPDVKVRPK